MRNREIYLGIDLLRFTAAAMVMAYHLGYKAWSLDGYYIHEKLGIPAIPSTWSGSTWFGWIGVQVFFVISGFVIAFSSESATTERFFIGRITRLVPVMVVGSTICFFVVLYWRDSAPEEALILYAKSLTFFPVGPWIAGQIWTLPIEIMFYGLILLLLMLKRFHLIDWIFFSLALLSAGYWVIVGTGIYVDHHSRTTQLLLLQHGCYFAMGGGLWLLKRKGLTFLNVAIILISIGPTWLQIRTTLLWESLDMDSNFCRSFLIPCGRV